MNPRRPLIPIILAVLTISGFTPVRAGDVTFYDDGELVLRAVDAGVFEPAIPIYHNGSLVSGGDHKVIEAFDRVPNTGSYPLTFVDLHANGFLPSTYQRADGTTASLGTSVVGAASYRTSSQFNFIPTIHYGEVFTNGSVRYESRITGQYGSRADYLSTREYPDPPIGQTAVDVHSRFTARRSIRLHTDPYFVNNDRFRIMTVSSMFANDTVFDANAIRYEDDEGDIHLIDLTNNTPRNAHLLNQAVEIGGWFELIKGSGSTWFPDSPTIRIEILDKHNRTLGLQGYLAGATDPNDDSLSVWLEWLGAPNRIRRNTQVQVDYRVLAYDAQGVFNFAPSESSAPSFSKQAQFVPEPAGLLLLSSGALCLLHRRR